jgi:hypothetical protein
MLRCGKALWTCGGMTWPRRPLDADCGKSVDIEPPAGDRIGAQRQRFDDVGAAVDAAVDHDAGAPADRLDQIVPIVAIEVDARLSGEFVEILKAILDRRVGYSSPGLTVRPGLAVGSRILGRNRPAGLA